MLQQLLQVLRCGQKIEDRKNVEVTVVHRVKTGILSILFSLAIVPLSAAQGQT